MRILKNKYTLTSENSIDKLMEYIDTHHLPPRERLPSERKLSELLGVSRPALHQAIFELINLGVLAQTPSDEIIIAEPKVLRNMWKMRSFTKTMRALGLTPKNKVIYAGMTEATKEEASALNLTLGSPVFRLHRLRCLDGTPMVIEVAALPAKLFPRLLEHDFSRASLYSVLEEEYGTIPLTQEQEFLIDFPNPADMQLLGIDAKEPLIVQLGRTADQNGVIIEYSVSKTLGSRFEFESISVIE